MSPRKIEIPDRFWSKVSKGAYCWEWQACRTQDGYGRFGIGRKLFLSHRVAYELTKGPIPDGMKIDHACHNRACVNPAHLRAVTHKQNLENRAGPTVRSKSGIRGVSFHKDKQKWSACVGHNGRVYTAGRFDKVEDAEAAVIALRLRLFTHNEIDKERADNV